MLHGNRRVEARRPDVFRDRNHRINYWEFSLSRDIETNPGPSVVDPSKTIIAPYNQGNVVAFLVIMLGCRVNTAD